MTETEINLGKLVFDLAPPLPWGEDYGGRIRIRLRAEDFATACLKTSEGIKRFAITERDGKWWLKIPLGENRNHNAVAA